MLNKRENKTSKPFNRSEDLSPSHKAFLKVLIEGNHAACSALVRSYLDNQISIKTLYEQIITKALYDVGELWEFNKISVATEHLASAIVEAILNELYLEIISKERNGKTMIAACVENEYHQIGIKMISDTFEMNGWNALFLGANTPTSELIIFIKMKNPDLLAISLSLHFNIPELEKMIAEVRKGFPGLPILVGGQAFRYGGQELISKYENVVFKPDLSATELFIKNFK
jgi:methanogenic corrinoid protein MtbC1